MAVSADFDRSLREWIEVSMSQSIRGFTHWMTESGLTRSQIGALMRLHFEGRCHISTIGDDLGITTAAASQLVDRLYNQGLLERGEDPDDRRVKRVELSDEGRDLVQQSHEARLGWMRALGAALSSVEQEQVAKALKVLIHATRQIRGDLALADAEASSG